MFSARDVKHESERGEQHCSSLSHFHTFTLSRIHVCSFYVVHYPACHAGTLHPFFVYCVRIVFGYRLPIAAPHRALCARGPIGLCPHGVAFMFERRISREYFASRSHFCDRRSRVSCSRDFMSGRLRPFPVDSICTSVLLDQFFQFFQNFPSFPHPFSLFSLNFSLFLQNLSSSFAFFSFFL